MNTLKLGTIDYAILLAYLVLVLAVGWFIRRFTKTSGDFFLAGRSIPAWAAALAFISANCGATEVVGIAACGAKYGMMTSHFYWLGAIPAMVFLGLFMMPFYYGSKARSVPEYLRLRFDEKTRTLNAVSFALMTVLVSGISMYASAKLLGSMLGWGFDVSLLVSAAIVLVYIVMGGLTSAIYNEVLQFVLIVAGFSPLVVRRAGTDGWGRRLFGWILCLTSWNVAFCPAAETPKPACDAPEPSITVDGLLRDWKGQAVAKRTPSGYLMEIGFSTPGVVVRPGSVLGVEIGVCDDDGQGRESIMMWTGTKADFWVTMDEYGEVRLVEQSVSAEPQGESRGYPQRPVPLTAVRVEGFWRQRVEAACRGVIPTNFRRCEETGRSGNFARAAGLASGDFKGLCFDDSDVYKAIEGAAYALALKPDPALDRQLDKLIADIAAAQEPDGYLYTIRRLMTPDQLAKTSAGRTRWSNEKESHELYCLGHLFEAAVAHGEATGKSGLLAVARKAADMLANTFHPGGLRIAPGHQEVELGLVRLYRATGEQRYLNTAKFFLDLRGRPEGRPEYGPWWENPANELPESLRHSVPRDQRLYGPWFQDHLPVTAQTVVIGHTVRALYQYAAMTDVAALTGDAAYRRAVESLWRDLVASKLHVHGGAGFQHDRHYHEQFTPEYELPEEPFDVDTCTVIGTVLWAHRMNLLRLDGQYHDLIERILYNRLLAGVSLDTQYYSYGLPLRASGPAITRAGEAAVLGPFAKDTTHFRKPWMAVACCPSNLARFLPTIGQYVYQQDSRRICVNQFVSGEAVIDRSEGPLTIRQETDYPWDGRVKISLRAAQPAVFELALRIPGWARGDAFPSELYGFADASEEEPVLSVDGRPEELQVREGYARLPRDWQGTHDVELRLPMPVRCVVAHPKVKALASKVAFQRGPVVYAFEACDHNGKVFDLVVSRSTKFNPKKRTECLGGIVVLTGSGEKLARTRGSDATKTVVPLTAIPFYAWDNREPGELTVWLPERPSVDSNHGGLLGRLQGVTYNPAQYAKLAGYSGDEHYREVARILLHNTKNMLAIPGRTFDLPGPGWQQEHWSFAPRRGQGLHRGWLPWVSTSHLNGIQALEEYDARLLK